MWDSSIGGKTGVDTHLGKNLVGSIYNPKLIISNTALLESLDDRNFKNGLVEVIKMGAIADDVLFEALEKTTLSMYIFDFKVLWEVI